MEGKVKTLYLKEAVTNIKMACDMVRPNQRSPYFFLVGAGISFPPIPLANQMVESFKEQAISYCKSVDLPAQQDVDNYTHWFRSVAGVSSRGVPRRLMHFN